MTMPKKTPAAQLNREIAQSLAIARASTSHSKKALATLAIMRTAPAQWQLTPIEWVKEEREVPGLVRCPTCRGDKFVRIADGQVIPPPRRSSASGLASPDWLAYMEDASLDALRANRPHGNCPTCGKQKGGWGMVPQGKIGGLIRAKVMVGYPRFPSGTRFDSRFAGGLHCNLCNKLLMRARRVPVHATGDDGVTHGMLVGEDCARKFLDVKIKRDEDSIMESGNAQHAG